MKKTIDLLLLILPICAFSQTVNLGVTKDLEWAKWTYESLEFRDDCTILKGYFVPSMNGCWVSSKMDETLKADDKDYRIIYTTIPTNRHPRTLYPGGIKVSFEEHYEPIFATGGVVHYTPHDISFSIPFKDRKATRTIEDLLPAYEEHIDTLICKGKYSIAAYLLNQYARKVRFSEDKQNLAKNLLQKYRVLDFFLNTTPDDKDILSLFKNTYYWFDFKGDDELLEKLEEIRQLQSNIILNFDSDNLATVINWCESLLPMIRAFGKYNRNYIYTLCLYRKALVMDGQTHGIPNLDNEIIDVCSHIYSTNMFQYLEHLSNIAIGHDVVFYNTSYDNSCGINLWKEISNKAKQHFPNSWRYANAVKEIAYYNYSHRLYDIALEQFLSVDSLYKERRNEWILEVWKNNDILSGEQSETYVDLLKLSLSRAIGYCFYQKADIANANKYDADNPYYYDNIDALTYWCQNSYDESIKGLKGIIKDPTIIHPGAYYEEVFDIAYTPALRTHIPYFAAKTHSNDLCEMAYNGALISKEFRLTTGNRLREYLRTTQDPVTKDYNKRIELEMNTYNSMIQELDLGSVEKRIEILQLQRGLINYLDSIGALDTYFPNWTEVHNVLTKNDLAIEFIEFPLWNQNRTMYAALTLRKDSKYPKITALFEENQLKEISDTLYFQCPEMYNLVWEPLRTELQGIKNIYFSPSGALYNIGIEYLSGLESYNTYRLSSTRELVPEKKQELRKSAVLYGGLDYYAQTDLTNTVKDLALLEKTFKKHEDVRSLGVRGSKEYLKHTKVEVDRIGEDLRKAEWICLLDTASLGTEESFKALSGREIGCLHLSTHGFYYTKEEADNAGYQFIQPNNQISIEEDKALLRSGLLLSGANNILDGKSIPNNIEDGILTAKEIAEVDLRGLDLVVLSACQTGLGDIAQGEGVFGLQRGFKKAGANTILMSLWKVDDKATQILMTQFYKNYVSGKTKHQSLLSAQKYLKEYEKGKYKEPKYWAAFILLDAKE